MRGCDIYGCSSSASVSAAARWQAWQTSLAISSVVDGSDANSRSASAEAAQRVSSFMPTRQKCTLSSQRMHSPRLAAVGVKVVVALVGRAGAGRSGGVVVGVVAHERDGARALQARPARRRRRGVRCAAARERQGRHGMIQSWIRGSAASARHDQRLCQTRESWGRGRRSAS